MNTASQSMSTQATAKALPIRRAVRVLSILPVTHAIRTQPVLYSSIQPPDQPNTMRIQSLRDAMAARSNTKAIQPNTKNVRMSRQGDGDTTQRIKRTSRGIAHVFTSPIHQFAPQRVSARYLQIQAEYIVLNTGRKPPRYGKKTTLLRL